APCQFSEDLFLLLKGGQPVELQPVLQLAQLADRGVQFRPLADAREVATAALGPEDLAFDMLDRAVNYPQPEALLVPLRDCRAAVALAHALYDVLPVGLGGVESCSVQGARLHAPTLRNSSPAARVNDER